MRRTVLLLLVAVATALALVIPAAAQTVPYYQITGGPTSAGPFCDNEGGSVPTFREFAVAGSVFGTVEVDGVGVVRTDTLSSFGPASGASGWSFDGAPFSVAAGTPITITIDTYPEPNLVGGVVYRTTLVFDCSDGSVISLVNDDMTEPAVVAATPVPVPGCDVTIPIPATAVGATINADTAVYWSPGEASTETFPAGLNLLAIGRDSSGAYTKVLFACGTYWVPTGVVGPNYDSPWNGTPLPTGVVG